MNEARVPPPDPPAWFWRAVESADGDLERFRNELSRLTRGQLVQAFAYFNDLARIFASPEYVVHMEENTSEDGAFDVGKWIVTQGRDYFRAVYDDPSTVPGSSSPGTREERMMMGEIMRYYLENFEGDMPIEPPAYDT